MTAMHDATECGLWGGLYEVARASRVGMRIERERIMVPEEVEKVCRLFAIDPFTSISEGTLVADVQEAPDGGDPRAHHREGDRRRGHRRDAPGGGGDHARRRRPRPGRSSIPRVDPFWAAFGKAMAEGDR